MALDSAHWLMIVGVLIGQLPPSIAWPLLAGVFVLVVFPFAYFRLQPTTSSDGTTSVCVVVLGDFGRSPRMQYHVLSLAKIARDPGVTVDVIAYPGSDPLEEIVSNKNIRIHYMTPPPVLGKGRPRVLFLIYAPVKVVYQVGQMLWLLLLEVRRPSQLLVQNPPSIPTLPVAVLVCWLRGCELVVDWHNYGYTILGLTLGEGHPLVKFAYQIEKVFGRLGHKHFCVTEAMQRDLKENWAVDGAVVLHDRPPPMFAPTPDKEKHALFKRIDGTRMLVDGTEPPAGQTAFTNAKGKLLPDRPALIVSSTSWTPDEDFSILLAALEQYDGVCEAKALPDVICVITGKGPLKAHYEKTVAEMSWKHVKICTAWLEMKDYPKLLGAADIGISLHTSSSGLDLPMKVVDMFGCGLPVCAKAFKCIDELVKHEVNGVHFDQPADLFGHLGRLLAGFPGGGVELAKYRETLRAFREKSWDANWKLHAEPMFT